MWAPGHAHLPAAVQVEIVQNNLPFHVNMFVALCAEQAVRFQLALLDSNFAIHTFLVRQDLLVALGFLAELFFTYDAEELFPRLAAEHRLSLARPRRAVSD